MANCSTTAVRLLSRIGVPAVFDEPFSSAWAWCATGAIPAVRWRLIAAGRGRIGSGTRRSSYVPAGRRRPRGTDAVRLIPS